MQWLKAGLAGLLIFLGWVAATFISGFLNGFLFAVFPMSGELALVGDILAFAIFAIILGVLVVWLLAKFG